MKTKKFSKKLGLNKATVANLSDLKMGALKGGERWTSIDSPGLCNTDCPTGVCCPTEPTEWQTLECCPYPVTIDADCTTKTI